MNLRSPTMEDAQVVHGSGVVEELASRFGPDGLLAFQPTRDEIPTMWLDRSRLRETLQYLRAEIPRPFPMLFDLSATDERLRRNHDGLPIGTFTVFYRLFSFARNQSLRIKVPLRDEPHSLPSI
ncbi:MAG TPA: NADH-quinone oxidoreductase subunit C, partial [Nitrospira sp.]|nr:NADH-quinone oxidoreductase subunit C [Nitrospira sp.]